MKQADRLRMCGTTTQWPDRGLGRCPNIAPRSPPRHDALDRADTHLMQVGLQRRSVALKVFTAIEPVAEVQLGYSTPETLDGGQQGLDVAQLVSTELARHERPEQLPPSEQ